MSKNRTAWAVGLALSASLPAGAQAAYLGSLQYIQPTGTVSPTDSIDVRVRLTLDPTSDALELVNDPVGPPPFGVPLANYPSNFDFTYYDGTTTTFHTGGTLLDVNSIYLNTFFECSGTFVTGCNNNPYTFAFNLSGPETINFIPTSNASSFSLAPGASFDYLFGSFTPDGGAAPAGTYTFFNTGLTLNFLGTIQNVENVLDANGDPIPLLDGNGDPILDGNGDPVYQTQTLTWNNGNASIDLALTPCRATGNACDGTNGAFVRTVVPVPAAGWLIFSALGALGFTARRR